ncbi:MAG: SDR family NAD(P)-dependent oxidoreductase [Phycicoccus sp.]
MPAPASVGLDALVNNAAVHYDAGQQAAGAALRIVEEAIATNLIGAWRTVVAMAPLLSSGGRVVDVSSGAGSFGETGTSAIAPAYSVSKAGLDMLTVKLAADLAGVASSSTRCARVGWRPTWAGRVAAPSSTAPRA